MIDFSLLMVKLSALRSLDQLFRILNLQQHMKKLVQLQPEDLLEFIQQKPRDHILERKSI